MKRIKVFDTTLRDGEQAPGYSMNISEKVEMARQLEALGVDIIEAGFAASSNEDFESIKAISAVVKNAVVCSLSRLVREDIERAYEAIKNASHPRLHVFIATSDIHLEHKLKATRQQVLDRVKELVAYSKSLCPDVEFSAEDASRSDWNYLAEVYTTAIEAGANVINVPDTVGYATPDEMYSLIRYLMENIRNVEKAEISVHCHNDLGMGVANTLAAVRAGATQIECTINGIGERAGNASLEELVMAFYTKKDYYGCETGINTRQIYKTSRLLSTITGVSISPSKPIVGANAFAHEAGIHQHGVLNNPMTYEIMSPESVGILRNRMVLGKHSGRHAVEARLTELGYELSEQDLEKIFVQFKKLTDKKKSITDMDLIALVGAERLSDAEIYTLESFSVQSGSDMSSTASIKLLKGMECVMDAAVGSGPIDAAFKAIERIANTGSELINYTIQSVTEGEDALGEAMVKLKSPDSDEIFTGHGLSTDIIEASIKAYVNGVNKLLASRL